MTQDKVEIVRRLIAYGEQARKSGPTEPPLDLVAPDIEIDLSRRVFNPDTYRGLDGLARMNEELREVWAEWEVKPQRIVAAGDRVVSIEAVRGLGRGSGLETKGRYASIWTFANVGRIWAGLAAASL